jgi:hypothetical protein
MYDMSTANDRPDCQSVRAELSRATLTANVLLGHLRALQASANPREFVIPILTTAYELHERLKAIEARLA